MRWPTLVVFATGCGSAPNPPAVVHPVDGAWVSAAGTAVRLDADPRLSDVVVEAIAAGVVRPLAPSTDGWRLDEDLDLPDGPVALVASGIWRDEVLSGAPVTVRLDRRSPSVSPPSGELAPVEVAPTLSVDVVDEGSGWDAADSPLVAFRDGAIATIDRIERPDGLDLVIPDRAGNWLIEGQIADVAGNATEVRWRVAVDHAAPIVAVGEPAVLGADVVEVTCACTDDTGIVRTDVRVTDGRTDARGAADGTAATVDVSRLAEGPVTVIVGATDVLGRRGVGSAVRVVDRTPPTVSFTAPVPGAVREDGEIRVTVADAGGVIRVELRHGDPAGPVLAAVDLIESVVDGEVSVPFADLPDGTMSLVAVAWDAAGRSGSASTRILVDGAGPVVEVQPAPGPLAAGLPVRVLGTDDGVGVDWAAVAQAVRVRRDGAVVDGVEVVVEADGVRVSLPPLDGVWSLDVVPVDALGNPGDPLSAAWSVTGGVPEVVSSDPEPGGEVATLDAPLVVVFDRDLAGATGTLVPDGIPVTTTVEGDRTVVVQPGTPLPANARFTFLVDVAPVHGAPLPSPLAVEVRTPALFEDITTAAGLQGYRAGTAEPAENHGPGAAFVDLTGDGWPDLFVVSGPGEGPLLYENVPDGGGGRVFVPIEVAPSLVAGGTGAVAADIDNDGDRDVFVTRYGADDVLFENQLVPTGAPDLVDVTALTDPSPGVADGDDGVARSTWGGDVANHSMAAVWLDADRDGWVDLYVARHHGWVGATFVASPGERDTLYRNNGDGTFTDVTFEAGVPGFETSDGGWSTGFQEFASSNAAIATDLDLDGWPDLVVTNKTRHRLDVDMVYHNLGEGPDGAWLGFETLTYDLLAAGLADSSLELPMGIDAADIDADGDPDLYITDFRDLDHPGPNEVWINQWAETGAIDFVVERWAPGVYSWGARFEDFDRDGRIDLHVSGNRSRPDLLYMAFGPDTWDAAVAWGVASRGDARGDVAADLDGDGWVDLFVTHVSVQPPRLLRNRGWVDPAAAEHHGIAFDLVGDPTLPGPHRSTRDALGARVQVLADVDGDGVDEVQWREVRSGGGNASSTSDLRMHVGLGLAASARVSVVWPSGRIQDFGNLDADRVHLLTEAGP